MIIAFANHKGGTGKTTSTINIGRVLTKMGKKVLLIDLDPQGNLSYSLGLSGFKYTVSDYMTGRADFNEVKHPASEMYVIPASNALYKDIAVIESGTGSDYVLKNKLNEIEESFDFILIDCPPSISIYTINGLNACDGVIIPLALEILSIQGLDQIIHEINIIQQTTNQNIQIIGALGVIVNESRKLSEEVMQYIRDNYQINIFNNHVRNNVKAAEAPSFGVSVIDYAPGSISAKDYMNVTNELMKILETVNY